MKEVSCLLSFLSKELNITRLSVMKSTVLMALLISHVLLIWGNRQSRESSSL